MSARRRHQSAQQGSGMGPIVAILGIVVLVGGVLALLNAQAMEENAAKGGAADAAEKDDEEYVDPFADVRHMEQGPPAGRRRLQDLSPPGLMETETFLNAQRIAEEGQALADEAFAAQKAGDTERFREVGVQAREKLLEATRLTADWWIDLNERYPNDRQVEKISRVRDKWDKSLKPLRAIK